MTSLHLVLGIDKAGEIVEEYFLDKNCIERRAATDAVVEHLVRVEIPIEWAIEKFGVHFEVTWHDQSGQCHEETWKDYERAERRCGNLLSHHKRAEIRPLRPRQISPTNVMDLH